MLTRATEVTSATGRWGMKTEDTRITQAGVMRCCLSTVATEHLGGEVEEGEESSCLHCGERFRLVGGTWKPVWQIERSQG